MQVINPLRCKPASELLQGELFVGSFGAGYSLAVLLKRLENARSLFMVLEGTGFSNNPAAYASDLVGPCLSYGTEWLLEVFPGPETFPQNSYVTDQQASLFLDGLALVLSLPFDGGFRPGFRVTFDMTAMSDQHQLSTAAAPVYRWAVWESATVRDRSNSRPIWETGSALPGR
jgi:hypothetical protein